MASIVDTTESVSIPLTPSTPARYPAPVYLEPAPIQATRGADVNPLPIVGVSVIVPAFNEEGAIRSTVRRLGAAMRTTARPYELIVIDDGSTDATTHELNACSDEPRLRILRNARNFGYGYSLKRAIAEARHEIIVITDGDGTYPHARIPELLDRLRHADMVVGARTTANVAVPWARRPAKWILTRLAGYLAGTPIPDLNSGLRVMKRSLVQRFSPLLPDGFSFTTTITLALHTHGYRIRYVPIDYARRIGRSSIRPVRDTFGFLGLIVRTVMYFKPLKVFGPASAILMALSLLVALVSKLFFGQLADVTALTLAMTSLQTLAVGLLADLIDKRMPSSFGPTSASPSRDRHPVITAGTHALRTQGITEAEGVDGP